MMQIFSIPIISDNNTYFVTQGLIPRAKLLLTIGGTFFLGFWPLILITLGLFLALYIVRFQRIPALHFHFVLGLPQNATVNSVQLNIESESYLVVSKSSK